MFTFSHELRTLRGPGEKPAFPAVVEFTIRFEPTLPFGVGSGPSRTVYETPPTFKYDACTGKFWVETEGPGPLQAHAKWDEVCLDFEGSTLRTKMLIQEEAIFVDILNALYSYLPVILSLRLREPVSVASASCCIGNKTFEYQALRSSGVLVNETDLEAQGKLVTSAVDDLAALCALQDYVLVRPVVAAMRYLQAAQRLLNIGVTPREFFGEALLNYAKVLEVLWGDHDDIRGGLEDVGVSKDEVETVFIPVCLIRNQLDVGHAALSLPDQSLLDRLYQHVEQIDMHFFRLMDRLLEEVRSGRTPYRHARRDSKDWQGLEAILDSLDRSPVFKSETHPFTHYRGEVRGN